MSPKLHSCKMFCVKILDTPIDRPVHVEKSSYFILSVIFKIQIEVYHHTFVTKGRGKHLL